MSKTRSAVIVIGASEASVKAAREAILAIMAITAPAEVSVQGLKTLSHLCAVKNTTITGCRFDARD